MALKRNQIRNRPFLWPIYLLFLISLFPEWKITSLEERIQIGFGSVTKTWLYEDVFLSFTKLDLLIIFLVLYFMSARRREIMYSRLDHNARIYLFTCAAIVILSFVISLLKSVNNPLAYFRPLAILTMTLILTRYLIAQKSARNLFIDFFNKISGAYMSIKLLFLVSGNGEFVPDIGHVSTYDSYVVYIMLLATLFNFNLVLFDLHAKQKPKKKNLFYIAIGILFAVFTFVRTIWFCLTISIILSLLSRFGSINAKTRESKKTFYVTPKFFGAMLVIGMLGLFFISPSLNSRLYSMNIWSTSASVQLGGQDNQEHLLDLQNGIEAVKHAPVFGSGLGAGYNVSGYSYKNRSVGFHNAPLTVWYWTGISGLFLWLILPFQVWKWSKYHGEQNELNGLFAKSIRIWFLSIFIATSLFSAWPLTSVQFSVFFGLIIGFIAPSRFALQEKEKFE